MKNFLLIVVFTFIFAPCFSQTISGEVKDRSLKKIQLTLLFADQQYKTSELYIPVGSRGRFKQTLTLPYPVFALLQTGNTKRRLLLSPGRNLHVNIDGPDVKYTGPAATENNLVHMSILDSEPLFIKDPNITLNGWKDSIINPVEKAIGEQTAAIRAADLPASIKKILCSETQYAYQCYLNDFTRGDLRWAKNPNADSLNTWVMQWQSMPDSLTLVSGYYANMILQRHPRYALENVAKDKTGGGPAWKARIGDFMGMPCNEIDSLVKTYGETAITCWLYARKHFPAGIRDKMIFNRIIEAADAHELRTARFLYSQMQKDHAGSNYLSAAKTAIHDLETAINSNAGNTGIRFNNAAGIGSLQDLVKPYAGKIVYLDIWGTWCPPCREQMRYAHELKKRYAGKDIVFVYLDKDDASKEGTWKEYVYAAGLEGEHYRMSQTEIEAIWKSIKEAGNEQIHTYPTYVIIDRQGAIVHPNAERPGSREKLYAQLDKIL